MENYEDFRHSLIPDISLSEAIHVAKVLYGLEARESLSEQLVGYVDKSFRLRGVLGNKTRGSTSDGEFVFKVLNAADSKDQGVLEAQTDMMKFLKEKGINCPTSIQSLQGNYIEWVKLPLITEKEETNKHRPEQTWYCVRLNNYIPGIVFSSVRSCYSLDLFFDVGRLAGKVAYLLQGFENEALKKTTCLWDSKNVLEVREYENILKNKFIKQKIASYFFGRFTKEFIPMLANAPIGYIHSDINHNNLLVDKTEEGRYKLSALLDFGSVSYSHRIFEAANAAAYMMLSYFPNDIIDCSGHIVAGYHSYVPLSQMEMLLLPLAISARLLTSAIMGLYGYSLNPENDYLLLSQAGWDVLEILMEMPDEKILKTWENIFISKNMEWPVDINNN